MTEETRDRSSRATMFGRIVLKNKLVDEAALKKVMAGLPAGSDLGEALVSAGLISAQHAAAIQKKIDERMGSATASQGATSGAAQSAAATPAGTGPTVADVQRMDFTEMSGQPIAEYLRKARELGCSDFHFQVDSAWQDNFFTTFFLLSHVTDQNKKKLHPLQ